MFVLKDISWRYILILFASVLILLFVWGYYALSTSEAYKFVRQNIINSEVIKQHVGEIKSTNANVFKSELNYAGGETSARIQVDISGSQQSAVANFEIQSSQGSWLVKMAKLTLGNGAVIDLNAANAPLGK